MLKNISFEYRTVSDASLTSNQICLKPFRNRSIKTYYLIKKTIPAKHSFKVSSPAIFLLTRPPNLSNLTGNKAKRIVHLKLLMILRLNLISDEKKNTPDLAAMVDSLVIICYSITQTFFHICCQSKVISFKRQFLKDIFRCVPALAAGTHL